MKSPNTTLPLDTSELMMKAESLCRPGRHRIQVSIIMMYSTQREDISSDLYFQISSEADFEEWESICDGKR